MPQQLQPAVAVTLVAARLVPGIRRRVGAEPAHRVAEGVPVVAVRVVLVPVQQAPRVALGVRQVEPAPAPVDLGDTRRERRVAVAEDRRRRGRRRRYSTSSCPSGRSCGGALLGQRRRWQKRLQRTMECTTQGKAEADKREARQST